MKICFRDLFRRGANRERLQRSPLSPLREGIVIGKKEQILSFLNKKAPALEIDKNAA